MGRTNDGGGRRAMASENWAQADFQLAVQIAEQYYVENASKVDIAKQFGVTRFQVGRILQECLRAGVVRIDIGVPGGPDESLGRQLRDELGLARAVVINAATDSYAQAVAQMGAALADLVAEMVNEGDLLGLSWSRTTDAMSRRLSRLRPCTVVQLAGHLHVPGLDSGSVEIVRRVATASGGIAYPIYAPMVVGDADAARSLRSLPEVATALDLATDVDTAVASVGAWQTGASQLHDALPADLVTRAGALGAVGEVAGRAFTIEGDPVSAELDDRVIAVTLDQLRHVSRLVLSGFGDYRAEAMLAALRATDATALVTDVSLARAMLRIRTAR